MKFVAMGLISANCQATPGIMLNGSLIGETLLAGSPAAMSALPHAQHVLADRDCVGPIFPGAMASFLQLRNDGLARQACKCLHFGHCLLPACQRCSNVNPILHKLQARLLPHKVLKGKELEDFLKKNQLDEPAASGGRRNNKKKN